MAEYITGQMPLDIAKEKTSWNMIWPTILVMHCLGNGSKKKKIVFGTSSLY